MASTTPWYGASVTNAKAGKELARQQSRATGQPFYYSNNTVVPQYTNTQGQAVSSPQATTGGGSPAPTQPQTQPQQPSAPSFQDIIDDAFSSTMSYLNKQESTLKGQLPGIENDINSMYSDSKASLGVDKAQGDRGLATAQQGGETRQEDAITAARRLYNELQMGGNQRFGGASSAGEAYGALAGRELQRNNQQIATDFSTFMGQIEGARTTINEKYTLALTNLESEKNRMLSEARRDLQNKLMQIEGQKATAQSQKANMKLQALQDMRNQVYQIQLAQAEGKTNLDTIKQSLESELGQYAQTQSQALTQSQGAGQTFAQGLDMNPQTNLAMSFGQGQQFQTPTGYRRDEDLTGQIYSPRDNLDNLFA